jgi:adenylate cyclase
MTKKFLIAFGLLLTALFSLDLSETQFKFSFLDKEDPPTFIFSLPFSDLLERQAYDLRVRLSASGEKDPRVVIIDIDEYSMKELGQWPFPRPVFAKMVDSLFDNYQIDTLGFDIIFPEPEDSYTDKRISIMADEGLSAQALLAELRTNSGDKILARSFENRSVVLGAAFQAIAPGEKITPSSGVLPTPAFLNAEIEYENILAETNAPVTQRYSSNIPTLVDTATATGFFSIAPQVGDPDGIIRRVELLTRYEDKLYASLSLQLVQSYSFDEIQPIIVDNAVGDAGTAAAQEDGYFALEGIRMLLADIPLDEQAAVYVPYKKWLTAYEYIPAVDIINGTYEGDIQGAIAIVGTSAAGLVDLRNTPVGASLPGVEVHANVVSALLDENGFRVKPSWVQAADIILVLGAGLLLAFALPYLSVLWSTVLFGIVAAATILGNWYFWTEQSMILTIAPILSLILSIYIMNMVMGFFAESQARKVTQKMFGLYVPPEVVGEMSENADIYSLASKKLKMTVLFCDIRDFTTISEAMPPEILSEWLNDFLTPMTRIIHKHGGAIDKYMGDAIMAFWGAPLPDENHAENAVRASIEMIAYLKPFNEEARAKGLPEVNIGVGVNTGDMSVGNMGSEFRMAYTVVGDAVNLGSRLEGLTKQYGVSIIVSEFTKEAAPNFIYEHLETVKVKGKNDAVTIFSCVGE